MQIKGIRIYVVIISVITTLAVLLGIQFVHQKYNVEEPLFKLYSQTKLVDKVDLEEKGNNIKVSLHVKKTNNLKEAYRELVAQTEEVVGSDQFALKLIDKRTPALESAFYDSQFIIYEAMAKGDFTKMAEVVSQNAAKAGAEAKVFLDNENVYVEFLMGDHYLYEIISRQNNETADRIGSDQG